MQEKVKYLIIGQGLTGTWLSYFLHKQGISFKVINDAKINSLTLRLLNGNLPRAFALGQNYPNPFSDYTTINYTIRKDATVSVSILDLLGNTVSELENGNQVSGEHTTSFYSSTVAEGMYLLQLKVDNTIKTKKIIVSK